MPKYSFDVNYSADIEADDFQEARQKFLDEIFANRSVCVDVVQVDEIDVMATCIVCDGPIVDGEKYHEDEDGVVWHEACDDRWRKACCE